MLTRRGREHDGEILREAARPRRRSPGPARGCRRGWAGIRPPGTWPHCAYRSIAPGWTGSSSLPAQVSVPWESCERRVPPVKGARGSVSPALGRFRGMGW